MFLCANLILVASLSAAAVAVVIAVILLLVVKKKKKASKPDDRTLIEQNSAAVGTIIAISENAEVKEQLRALQEKLKYLIPSDNDKVYEADEYITYLLREFRIKLTAAPQDTDVSDEFVKKISVSVESRNAML